MTVVDAALPGGTLPLPMRAIGDTVTLTGRSLRHVLRSPDTIITSAIIPIALMLLFVYVFGGAIDPDHAAYVTYQLPGILLITVASGVSYTAYRLFLDLRDGIFDRFRSLPIARSAVLWAHVLTSVVANLISVLIVLGVAMLIGFRSSAGVLAWLGVLAVIPGLTAKSVDGATAFSYPLIFLPLVSSAFVPTDTMPGPVRWFAENQPVTSIVETMRALLSGRTAGADATVALAWCLGVLTIAVGVALAIYRKRLRG
jgi:ABC-2 type transport system permease protein